MVQEYFDQYTEELSETLKALNRADIQMLWEKMEEVREAGGKVFVLGAQRQPAIGSVIFPKESIRMDPHG